MSTGTQIHGFCWNLPYTRPGTTHFPYYAPTFHHGMALCRPPLVLQVPPTTLGGASPHGMVATGAMRTHEEKHAPGEPARFDPQIHKPNMCKAANRVSVEGTKRLGNRSGAGRKKLVLQPGTVTARGLLIRARLHTPSHAPSTPGDGPRVAAERVPGLSPSYCNRHQSRVCGRGRLGAGASQITAAATSSQRWCG